MPKQILVVDDSVTIQRVVEITFAREDAKLTVATNADDALAKARELRPDLVLIDAQLPGKNGYELCTALRGEGLHQTAVLILTGNFAPYDEAKGQAAGADGFAVKPFETQGLIDKANDAIARKSGKAPSAPAVTAPAAAPPPPVAAPVHPQSTTTPGLAPTMTMPAPVIPAKPATPPAPKPPVAVSQLPTPVATPVVKSKEDELEISIEKAAPKAAPPPVAPPPPKPAPPPVAAVPKPTSPPATPQASTMMMEAPKLPPNAAPKPAAPPAPTKPPPRATILGMPVIAPPTAAAPSPPAAPPKVEAKAPEPPKPSPPEPKVEAKAPEPPKPSPPPPAPLAKVLELPTASRRKTMPADVPKMPRPSLIASIPQPQPKPNLAPPSLGNDRATTPSTPAAKAEAPLHVEPSSPKAEMPAQPTPRRAGGLAREEASPLVSAVVERASAQVAEQLSSGESGRVSREVIERIAWEVVPELAEVIIKEHIDRLAAGRRA